MSTTWYKKAKEISDNDTFSDWVKGKDITPEEFGRVIKGGDPMLASWAASSERCPPEALSEVLRSGRNDIVAWSAANNINCPVKALVEVLRRKKADEVSKRVIANGKVPEKEKFLWMLNSITNVANTFFLIYLTEKDPQIRNDEEIREVVKDKLLNYIFNVYKPLNGIFKHSILNDSVIKLLNEFQDDFEVSVVMNELNELRKTNTPPYGL